MNSIENIKAQAKAWKDEQDRQKKAQRRERIENQIMLALISFCSGAIFGLGWAYMQKLG